MENSDSNLRLVRFAIPFRAHSYTSSAAERNPKINRPLIEWPSEHLKPRPFTKLIET